MARRTDWKNCWRRCRIIDDAAFLRYGASPCREPYIYSLQTVPPAGWVNTYT
jgi:hypothetical protein